MLLLVLTICLILIAAIAFPTATPSYVQATTLISLHIVQFLSTCGLTSLQTILFVVRRILSYVFFKWMLLSRIVEPCLLGKFQLIQTSTRILILSITTKIHATSFVVLIRALLQLVLLI